MSELVTALWVGSHVADLPDRTVLFPGQSTYQLPRHEAEESANWQIVEPAKPKHTKPAEAEG